MAPFGFPVDALVVKALSILLVVALIALAALADIPDEHRQCNTATDCTSVQTGCCGLPCGGKQSFIMFLTCLLCVLGEGVNVQFAKEHEVNTAVDCMTYVFPTRNPQS